MRTRGTRNQKKGYQLSQADIKSQSNLTRTPPTKHRNQTTTKTKETADQPTATNTTIIMIKTYPLNVKGYHYEYFAYTDNLCYGRIFLGKGSSSREAERIAENANKGCYVIEKHRVYY